MSNNAIEVINNAISDAQGPFQSVLVDRSINFEREAKFALQILTSGDSVMSIARDNPQSVIDAVTNIAAIGISLNPALKQAYLVPRKRKICLDISYMGLMDLAMATGSLRWAQAQIVHQRDQFALNGFDHPPTHIFNPFATDRGEIVGAYVVVKTADGEYLTSTMSVDAINDIRDRSEAWKAWISKKASCPWVTDYNEMAKKTVVKNASKYWPRTDRLDVATHYLNTDGGEGLVDINKPANVVHVEKPTYSDEQFRLNTEKWSDLILAGKKTPQDIINSIRTKYVLTDDQVREIEQLNVVAEA